MIADDFQVAEAVDEFEAVGCGGAVARGALFASRGGAAHERVMLALKAAERLGAGVRQPFHIIKLPAEK